ncbi:hypothetical protein LVJ82_17515 [Vitreoscilla massiliensis]|uniref:Lipoprotein n=1 Tax=Vitreoscilla massiliensis TaxID=1689272 RepID=A0ABY4E764_9NEIS|nr:hypothetical protein [Vitreoscilla massiliensis]UOO89217.1 hypothetical protein LVJ82_17515 [Vitreoscilla massiliensis]
MKNPLHCLLVLSLATTITACDSGSAGKAKKDAEEVYDYRNERYQDFYSRYMRKTKIDYLIITPQVIRKKLGLDPTPDDVFARVDIERVKPSEQKTLIINNLNNQEEILAYYNRNGTTFAPCNVIDQVEHFFVSKIHNRPNGVKDTFMFPLNPSNLST